MTRMRTITATASYFKEQDPGTNVTEYLIRNLVKLKKINFIKTGNRVLLDINSLESYFTNQVPEDNNSADYGIIRKFRKED